MKMKIGLLLRSRLLSKSLIDFFSTNKNIKIIFYQSDLIMKNYLKKKIKSDNISWVSNKKKNENQILKILKKNSIDLIISSQHSWILSKKIIDKMKGNIFNCHFGKLPEYRGHDPINYSIINNEKYCWSTLHKITDIVDSGYIISQKKIIIGKKSPRELESLMVKNFINQISKFLLKFSKNQKIYTKKIILKKSRFFKYNNIKKIKKVKNIKNFLKKIQALNHAPHEPAYVKINKRKIYLLTDYKEYLNFKNQL